MRKVSRNKNEEDSKSTDESKNSIEADENKSEKNASEGDINEGSHSLEENGEEGSKKLSKKRNKQKPPKKYNDDSENEDDASSETNKNGGNDELKAPLKKRGKQKATKKNDNEEEIDKEETSFEVESIVDSKRIKGKLHYLIKWKGYSSKDNSWEPEESVSSPELIEKFNKEKKNVTPKKGVKRKAGGKSKPQNKRSSLKEKFDYENADEDEEYEVEKILEVHHNKKGKREFLIHWKGWSSKHDTWEPEEHLNCKDLIEKFMTKVSQKKSVDDKDLRVAPKRTDRFTLAAKSGGRRLSKRNNNKQRVRYDDAE